MKTVNHFELWLLYILKTDFLYKRISTNFFQNSLNRIILTTSVNDLGQNKQSLLYSVAAIRMMTNQKPAICRTKKAISFFKVKKDMAVGAKTILNGKSMYDFLNLFVHLILPKIDNFRGIRSNALKTNKTFVFCFRDLNLFPIFEKLGNSSANDVKISVALIFDKQNKNSLSCLLSAFQIPLQLKK